MVRQYLETYRFTSIARYFQLQEHSSTPVPGTATSLGAIPAGGAQSGDVALTAVSVVVPCYNEEQSLAYLAKTLRSVVETWDHLYRFSFVFVDDCSTDRTWELLQGLFGADPACTLLRHSRNLGVAAAIRTGLHAAKADIVCSMDCDCTYDPHELGEMIPLLTDDVDVVTASPYHPMGKVKNVPQWRLFLSKSLSRLYRLVLRQKLHTYTSCFRVYRRGAAIGIPVERGGFFGVTEMLGRLDLAGRRIVEYPTTLEARMLGRSKMKVVRTIAGHLGLMAHLLRLRLSGGASVESHIPRPAHE